MSKKGKLSKQAQRTKQKLAISSPAPIVAPPVHTSVHGAKYPPSRNTPIFVAKWHRFIDGIVDRANFKLAHLETLEILCVLYEEHEQLSNFIATNGMTYIAKTSQGELFRTRPEAQLLQKVKSNIKEYTKLLDLMPKKDKSTKSGGESQEWD